MNPILVVEDSRTQAAALKDILEASGFEVVLAADGEQAWQLLNSTTFDVIITDVLMPVLTGHELCRRIKDDPDKQHQPVILLTELKAPIDIISGLESGADNFITKPYDPDYLIRRVRDILERRAATGSAKLTLEAEVVFLGKKFTVNAEKSQIVELLLATFEETVRTNEELKQSQARLAAAMAQVEHYSRQMESQARASEDKYKRLMEQANDGIFLLDPAGVVAEVNRRGEEIVGKPESAIVGRLFEEVVPSLKLEASKEKLQELHATGAHRLDNISLKRPDGKGVWIDLSTTRVEIGGKSLVLAIARDVTDRRRLEERYHQAHKLDAIGQLAGGMAHDFNNLLTVISGYSEVLLSQMARDTEAASFVQQIQSATERAASLTRQLLVFSRKQVLEPKVLDLNAVIMDTQKLLRRLIGEDINLDSSLEPNLGLISGDQGQMEQVIMNLVLNARDAMPRGGKITIETANFVVDAGYARTQLEVEPGHYVRLAVSDTGTGMSEDVKAHIFEPFFTTKEAGKGTGLGLATVYGIIKQSRGYISVYSEPGEGTTIQIYLPQIEKKVSTARLSSAPQQDPRGQETILVVEDGEAVRIITCQMLQRLGYRVLEARSGDEAIRCLADYGAPIDLLVTDVVMPHMGGRQLAEQLAQKQPGLKVLYVSGYMDDAIVRHGILQAEVAFLHKPFTMTILAHKVREVLDKSS